MGTYYFGRVARIETCSHSNYACHLSVVRSFALVCVCDSFPKAMTHVMSMLSFLGVEPFNEVPSLSSTLSPAQLLLRNMGEYNPALFCALLSGMTWWQRKRHVRLHLPPVQTKQSPSKIHVRKYTSVY